MSEDEAKDVTCNNCNEKVPSGNYCIKCGKEMKTQPRDGKTNEPHLPVQASDASLLTASGSGIVEGLVPLNEQNSGTAVAPPNNIATSNQNNTVTSSSSSNTESSSSYADTVKSSQPKDTGHHSSSKRSGTAGAARVTVTPHNVGAARKPEGNSFSEGQDMRTRSLPILVNFHVIIPIAIWDWSDYCHLAINIYQEQMYLSISRYSHRWAKYDAVEVMAHAHLPLSYMSKKVPYKYVVMYGYYINSYEEHIHDLPVKDSFNRCLELGNQAIIDKGVYHVYDGFIFPSLRWHEKLYSYITKVNINTKESHGYALFIYLQNKRLIDATDMTIISSTISNLLERTCEIYFQLKEKNYMYSDERKGCLYFNCTEQLHKGLEKWFIQAIEYLGNHQSDADHTRVWSASIVMALITIMRKTGVQSVFNVNAFKVMFTYLCLKKSQHEFIVGFMEPALRVEVASAIAYACSLAMAHNNAKGVCNWHWLYAVPLLHQLHSQDGVPQDYTCVDPDNFDWGINGLDEEKLQNFKCLVQNKRMMKNLFAELEDHIKSDHLLLRLLIYLSTEDDIDVVLDHTADIPVCIFALHISNQCQQYDKLSQRKSQIISHAVKRICEHVTNFLDGKKDRSFCTMVAAKRILVKLASICENSSDHTTLFYWSIKFCLVALSVHMSKPDDHTDNVYSYVTEVKTYFMEWFIKPSIGYEDYFGGKNGKMIKKEVELWNDVLTLDKHFQLLPCISEEWKLQIKQIIQTRMHSKQLSVSTKVSIALEICKSTEINNTLSDIVWKSVAEIMEDASLIKEAQDVIDNKSDNSNTGLLLSQLLINHYALKEIDLTTLLSFCLWPEYLKHFVSKDKLALSYTEECTKKCTEASDYILNLIDKLKSGSITVEELQFIVNSNTQVIKLFSIVVKENVLPDFSQLINQRMSELEKFNSHHRRVKNLLKHCNDISEGDLIEDLQDNFRIIKSKEKFNSLKISELYEEIDGNEVYALLNINDAHVVEMLQPFTVMMDEFKNVITQNIWCYHVREMDTAKLSLPEIAIKIWAPCFEEIVHLVETFCDRSVSLKKIDYYLKGVSSDLSQEILRLVEGCNKCLNKASTTWVPHFVDSVNHYRIIDKAKDVADLVIAAKNVLKMNDGFDKLEDCKIKMSGQADLSLEEFEQEGYNFEELEAIAGDDNKVEFLRILSTSEQLIEWLKTETKDVSELHNLVGLSMIEENACTMDRVAKLHTVGSAIAPLVYNLDADGGLCGFLNACEPVWKAIQKNPELPDAFKSCRDELKFLKLLKDLQAPIEVSTYDQIRDILKSGKFYFGSKRFRIFSSTEETIKLRVMNSSNSKQKYTLTELQELESKIVLIRDHRCSSDKLSSDEIEHFLNALHFALHIAETLLNLQRAGHPQYIEWLKCFDFETMSENDLQILIQEMKRDLQDWLDIVSNLRAKYYALNYFTCLQLLRINREFYNLINSNDYQISSEIFLLLLSISSDLTIENIKNIVSAKYQLISSENMSLSLDHDDGIGIIDECDIPEEVSKLTTEEKEVYDSFVEDCEFEPCMVLEAIHQVGPDEDLVTEWCLDPQNIAKFSHVAKGESFDVDLNEPQIDKNNAIVKELIGLEYSEALSIEAVKHCGEDLVLCMEYCTNQSDSISDAQTNDESISSEYGDTVCSDEEISDTEDCCLSVTSDKTSKYFDLRLLGVLMDSLQSAEEFSIDQSPRRFIKCFEKGTPNFLSVPSCAIFKTVISIYAKDKLSPLPSLEEVLICNQRTTVEEISLLWYRAARDPGRKRIFCLVNGEKLSYQVCVKALELMDEILKEITDYQLVIVCSSDAQDRRSYIMDHLQFFHRDTVAVNVEDKMIYKYLNLHMKNNREFELKEEIAASDVDPEKYVARVVKSERAGMGKSLYVNRLTDKLEKMLNQSDKSITYSLCVTIPVHGPTVDSNEIMKSLQHSSSDFAVGYFPAQIFHFDIASSVLDKVDALLFSMLVLKGFYDECGNVWRCFPNQLYLVEATYESSKQGEEINDGKKYCSTVEILELIPSTLCCSPTESLSRRSQMITNTNYWDEVEISSDYYQRPYQFLLRLFNRSLSKDLDKYSFANSPASGEVILTTVLKHFGECGVVDPSWMELKHFLNFLNAQFEDCEKSIFCNMAKDELPGFKAFVIKFMLKMAKDFAVPSLKIKIKDQSFDTEFSSSSLVEFDRGYSQSDTVASSSFKVSTSTPKRSITFVPILDSDSEDHIELNSQKVSDSSVASMSSSSLIELSDIKINDDTKLDTDAIEQLQIHNKRVWDKNFHPYIFFNKDHNSMTFIGFSVKDNGDLFDPATRKVIHRQLFTRQLLRGLQAQKVILADHHSNNQEELLHKLLMVMGIDADSELLCTRLDNSYVLTADNTKKILAILMRFRCNIPVILMGETGCGKTRLIKYMCHLLSLNTDNETLVIMKVHGGVTKKGIIEEVTKARKLAKQNARDGLETVMFFDEANTTEAIELIKEVMCDNRIRGEPIEENIKFIAACNPYKKHSQKMIDKLENSGLGYYVHSVNTKQKLGTVPLRHLVYRVLDLPSSMQSLVYDFGQLSSDTEKSYAEKIVKNYELKIEGLDVCGVTDVLMACQNYMRKKDDECSFVSLRDIERAMIVLEWFHKILEFIEEDISYANSKMKCNRHKRALILTIAVCYYTKLQCRDEFEKFISPRIINNCYVDGDIIGYVNRIDVAVNLDDDDDDDDDDNGISVVGYHDDDNHGNDGNYDDNDDDDDDNDDNDDVLLFRKEIIRCQEVFLRNMKIPPYVACNAALRENVFMMIVCIELKIPLFLVGKPGSSKSLAKCIVADSMQGAASSNTLFQHFKQVQLFSYQCSEHSTSETILEVFDNAAKFQKKKEGQNCVSVVVLDEVGLAEDSPSLPLKTLHPLLEDGTTKSNDMADRVAFIGISNWALDPAKMNRGIMVTRDDPGVDELVISARGICTANSCNEVYKDLNCFFGPFANAYLKICDEQIKTNNEFFGLRDFYSLIKMMYYIYQKNGYQKLTMNQLLHCLKRNFGGKLEVTKTTDIFLEEISAKDLGTEEITSDISYDSSPLGLIKANLQSKDTTWHGENRYLLLLTENYSALRILLQANLLDHDPLVLFGSSFPQDLNYTQVCRNISQIKFCMDTGRAVVLLNLEHLYASLYDLLNQYYITLSNTRYVDLGLQSHRIKCRVHPDFKIILIADKDKVHKEFPIPLINRLEKHYLITSIMLSKEQIELMKKIELWVKGFSKVKVSTINAADFTPNDAFVGYQQDTPASIVLKVWQDLKLDDGELSDQDKDKAFSRSKEYLLQIATPDSAVRCKHSENFTESHHIMQTYFKIHSYMSMSDFLSKKLNENSGEGLVIQITTHASLLQYKNLISIQESNNFSKDQISLLILQQFDTEIDFRTKIRSVFQRESAEDHLLIVQCDSGHQHIDLIACARYCVLDEAARIFHLKKITHIVFIIGLPRISGGSAFVSFQGAKWKSYHMDSLMSPKDSFFTIEKALTMSINDLLLECYKSDKNLFTKKIQSCITPTSLLQFSNVSTEYTLQRYEMLSQLVCRNHSFTECKEAEKYESLQQQNGQYDFSGALYQQIFKTLKVKKNTEIQLHEKEWAINEAMKYQDLHKSGSFKNALICKVDQKIVIALNVILNAVDKYCNLCLLQSEVNVISNLWFKIFEDGDLFLNVAAELENITAGNSSITFIAFKCQFPFFWLFVNFIENQLKICANQNSLDIYKILIASSKSLVNKLEVVSGDDVDAVFKYYSHDFILYFCKTSDESVDAKIYEQLIHKEYREMAQNISPDDLLHRMLLLHIAYHNIENCLLRLKRILVLNLDISSKLLSYFTEEISIGIDLYAVQQLLKLLQPSFSKEWELDDCKQWLYSIHGVQNIINATIIANTDHHSEISAVSSIWKDWKLLRVLQIFVEHTLEYSPRATILYARRLNKFLSKDHDFTKLSVYKRLKTTIDNYLKDHEIKRLSTKEKAKNSYDVLMLEIISEIIFATTSLTMNEPPEDELVLEMIQTVISKQQLSFFSDNKADKIPLVRSHILQLLLDYDRKKVKAHLQTFFTTSFDMLKGDNNFLVLCTQCFENSYHKQASNGSFIYAIQLALELLEQAKKIIDEPPDVMTLDYVESVAKLRYTLETVAGLLHDYYLDPTQFDMLSRDEKKTIARLISSVQAICIRLDEYVSKDALMIADFLVKCVVRKYGMSTLMTLCKNDINPDFSWLIPMHLQKNSTKSQKDSMFDPFVIYGKQYVISRNSLVATSQEENLKLASEEAGIIVLALNGAIDMCHVTNSSNIFNDKISTLLKEYIGSCNFSSNPMLAEITSQLIDSTQAFSKLLLDIIPKKKHYNQQLCSIVVHTVVVIKCNTKNSLLSPLQHFIQCSRLLKNMYFPTMPHDELFETAAVSDIGTVYKCKNGHPFVVTECGKPTQQESCPSCNEPIGGIRHVLTKGNVEYKGEDTTQTGHLLGPAQHLTKQATPERDLSPVACTIMRLIMHAALIWGSVCESQDVILDIIHPTIKSQELLQYLWQHLIRDLELLSKVIGHSIDDAAMIIHLILQEVHNSTYAEKNFDLLTKESRRKWEQQFYTMFVQPMLTNMSPRLQAAQELVTNDDRQAHNVLLQTVYEKNTDDTPPATMWRYRSRITIEHLGFFIEQQKSSGECPVLREYLRQETKIRAMQYLPDIIQLQQFLAKSHNMNVDDEQVNKATVMDLRQVEESAALIKLAESFYNAWILVEPFLFNYGRKKVPKELAAEMANDPKHILLAYLIPTQTGKGICSTALVDFLITTHNEFIQFCHEQVDIEVMKQTLPLHELQDCYLVANERQFMSIVISHCHYSLTHGKETEVHYDLPALERHFLSRFVYGKPIFDLSTACVVDQCKTIHNSENFAAIKRIVQPQKSITPDIKRAIIEELHDSQKLHEVLEKVNTILTILAKQTSPDSASKHIGLYAKEILRCKLPAKVAKCTLGNIISLWETLVVEQARRAVLDNQDIFKDISHNFKQQLDWTMEDEKKFRFSLRKFHIDKLLGLLYQFIVLFIQDQSKSGQSKDWPLVDTFAVFLEQEELGDSGFGAMFKTSFPKSIALSYTVDVWKKIARSEASTGKRNTS